QVRLWHILGHQKTEGRKRDRCSREDGRGGASSQVLKENPAAEDERTAGHRALLVFVAEAGSVKG
ncbi:unnamed protein product, partial [Ectocarpus sp. 4 AP-2014]